MESGLLEVINYEQDLPIKVFVHSAIHSNWHYHSEYEILLLIKGSVNTQIDKKTYTTKKDQIIVMNSSELHNVTKTDESNLIIAIQISQNFGFSSNKLEDYVFDREKLVLDQENDTPIIQRIKEYLTEIFFSVYKKNRGYKYRTLGFLNLLMHLFIQNYYLVKKNEIPTTKDTNSSLIRNIQKYINDNYFKPLTLQEIVEKENLSYYYLSHLFKETTGISFKDYLTDVRIEKSIPKLLNENLNLSEIALSVGFPDSRSYNKGFLKKYDVYPLDYRKRYCQETNSHASLNKNAYGHFDEENDISELFNQIANISYTRLDTNYVERELNHSISFTKESKKINTPWNYLTTFGRAHEALRANVQNQLTEMQKDIGFKYARFHGIFADDMSIINYDYKNNIFYNWLYVDTLIDFLLSINLKPFIELGFMPSDLASDKSDVYFWWNANVSLPKSIDQWTNLVQSFLKHCINRYGILEVSSWYFEVWNEPNFSAIFFKYTQKDYFELYEQTAKAIKSVDPRLRVGGPSVLVINENINTWLPDFVEYCKKTATAVDFITFHVYLDVTEQHEDKMHGTTYNPDNKQSDLVEENLQESIKMQVSTLSKMFDEDIEFHITEWNISGKPLHRIRDIAFMAQYIIKSNLLARNLVTSLGFWAATDLMEEQMAPVKPFNGGLGLINHHGIKKSSYFGYVFLSKLGDFVVYEDNNVIVTKKGDSYQLLLMNLAKLDDVSMKGEIQNMSETERYHVFKETYDLKINLSLPELTDTYTVISYHLNRSSGSAFDEWLNMGSPSELTSDQISYLMHITRPKQTTFVKNFSTDKTISFDIPSFGCVFIELNPSHNYD